MAIVKYQVFAVEKKQDIELEMVSADGLLIEGEQGQITSVLLPKSITLLQTIKVASNTQSVTHWKGQTYVGLWNNKVVRIDGNYQLNTSFLSFNNCPEGIGAYNDRLYTLVGGDPHVVHVHDK